MEYRYALEALINRGEGLQWETVATADSVEDLHDDANNWTLDYRVVDAQKDRYSKVDVGPSHFRLTKWRPL